MFFEVSLKNKFKVLQVFRISQAIESILTDSKRDECLVKVYLFLRVDAAWIIFSPYEFEHSYQIIKYIHIMGVLEIWFSMKVKKSL